MNGYFYIAGTIFFTIYGQLILKWRLTKLSFQLPNNNCEKIISLIKLIFDPFVFSGFLSAFIASLFWMATMTKLEITKAYPFMSLAPALVLIFGFWFLNEEFTWGKVLGVFFIFLGLLITVRL